MPVLLRGVLITHLHSDHLSDLNDLITTQWIMTAEPTPLRIWGPSGIARYVDLTLQALAPDIGYRIGHHDDLTWEPVVEVTEVSAGDKWELSEITIEAHETAHAPVEPTLGYRIIHDGKTVALAGDTIPCAGLDELCRGADIYVQTVIRDDIVTASPSQRFRDILDYHSTVSQAAQTAARGEVSRLVLTHMVPAPQPDQYDEWKALAAEHFDGEIVIGDDLTTVVA